MRRLSLSGRLQGYAIDRLAPVRIEEAPTTDFIALADRLDSAVESPAR